jgi:hypothetical protein
MDGGPPEAVAAKFQAQAPAQRAQLLALRQLILDVAAATEGVGRIEETLKWGQASYLTPETGSGTTIRIDAHPEGGAAIYVNCQTNLVETFRGHYPQLTYEGVRAVILPAGTRLPEQSLRHIIALALTYHARKKGRRTSATT